MQIKLQFFDVNNLLAQLLKTLLSVLADGFDSLVYQIGHSVAIGSLLYVFGVVLPGAKPRRWTLTLVTHFGHTMRRRLEKNDLGFSTCFFGQFKLHFVQYIV